MSDDISLMEQLAKEHKARAPEPCDAEYHPMANALALCTCGHPVAVHKMVSWEMVRAIEELAAKLTAQRLEEAERVRAMGTPIRWYHRLWWRVKRWWT